MARGKGIGSYFKYDPLSIGINASKNISKRLANSPLRYLDPSLAAAHEVKKKRTAKKRSSAKPTPARKRPLPSTRGAKPTPVRKRPLPSTRWGKPAPARKRPLPSTRSQTRKYR